MDDVSAGTMTLSQAAEAHLDDVHAYLVYLTGDRALAEELTAATFERAVGFWRRFDPGRGSVRTVGAVVAQRSTVSVLVVFAAVDVVHRAALV